MKIWALATAMFGICIPLLVDVQSVSEWLATKQLGPQYQVGPYRAAASGFCEAIAPPCEEVKNCFPFHSTKQNLLAIAFFKGYSIRLAHPSTVVKNIPVPQGIRLTTPIGL